ncbi:homeobox protein unc-62-like [Ostrea edulis]|uniref:homeobox protein unc-62-like n=1 Tax=Ostrea edulis TaxID=37623 RepID=UPI0024AF9A53|nr:homeobox protein unc-62-like [Ostrea edulis]
MEISAQLVNPVTAVDQKPISPSLLHLPSTKLPTLQIDDFLELGLDDSFSDILPHVEDDLDSLTDIFNPLRNGPMDILIDTTQSSVSSKASTVIAPDANSSLSSSSDEMFASDSSNASNSTESKDILSRALKFSDLSYLDASSEKIQPSASRSPSDCCFGQSPVSIDPSNFDVGVSTCQFSVSLEDLVREPSPVCAALTHITDVKFPTEPHNLEFGQKFQPNRRRRTNFPKKSIEIMEDWYAKHLDHPYPDSFAINLIAFQGGITVEQVKKWFGNKRNRSNNTRNLTDIAKKKRQHSLQLLQ